MGLIKRAGRRLIVIPLSAVGGAFPLVERDPKSGTPVSSSKWLSILDELKKIDDLVMVGIDTFNAVSHGDENNALAVAEMMREAGRVCGRAQGSPAYHSSHPKARQRADTHAQGHEEQYPRQLRHTVSTSGSISASGTRQTTSAG